MNISFKTTRALWEAVRRNLVRPHPFAFERVGFISCRPGTLKDGLILIAHAYHTVADDDYIADPSVGAMMSAKAIRKALQVSYTNPVSMFHVHGHFHQRSPGFSRTDLNEAARFVPDFWHVRSEYPHGIIVIGKQKGCGLCWHPGIDSPSNIMNFTIVGCPQEKWRCE
jgi:hypothetical protein